MEELELAALKLRVAELELLLAHVQGERAGPVLEQSSLLLPPTCQTTLSPFEISRYGRQMLVPGVGAPTQAALRSMKVLVIGAGGLGCPAALYLAGAGVGSITVVDDDVVEVSNLHRQIAHSESCAGRPKAESLCAALRRCNSSLEISAICSRFGPDNASSLVSACDVVVDCSDNVATRYLANDACVLMRKVLVSGAALGTSGQLSVHDVVRGGPCYRCVHPVPPPHTVVGSCAENGVLGPVTGVIGALQALEVIKHAADIAVGRASAANTVTPISVPTAAAPKPPAFYSLSGRMLVLDAADARVRTVSLRRPSPGCAICGNDPSILSIADRFVFVGGSVW
jgi:molybdopterin/thiamine biosynthesis adenylyltransferase